MLSDFFSSKNDDKDDFFVDAYNDVMINKIKNTFEIFGKYLYLIWWSVLLLILFVCLFVILQGEEADVEHCLPPLPVLDFDFSETLNFWKSVN